MFFLAMQPDVRHVGIKFPHHWKSKDYSLEIKDRLQLQTALPEFHPKNEILHKVHLLFSFFFSSMCYINSSFQLFLNVWGERSILVKTRVEMK